jgi:hypothetical protein
LQCAIQVACPFLTLDDRLRDVARSLDIPVEESIGSRFPDNPRGNSFGTRSFAPATLANGKYGVTFSGAPPIFPQSPFCVSGIETSLTVDEILRVVQSPLPSLAKAEPG